MTPTSPLEAARTAGVAHTPTPWRVGNAGYAVFGPPNGQPSPATVAATRRAANAAHIVRCVNAHDELVAALGECMNAVLSLGGNEFPPHCTERARLILAKLGEVEE